MKTLIIVSKLSLARSHQRNNMFRHHCQKNFDHLSQKSKTAPRAVKLYKYGRDPFKPSAMIYTLKDLTDPLATYLKDDPVRPHIPHDKRFGQYSQVFAFCLLQTWCRPKIDKRSIKASPKRLAQCQKICYTKSSNGYGTPFPFEERRQYIQD